MKLFFRNFGKGQSIIILHGLLGVSDNWVTLGKKLSENYNVFIPDLRNHGRSEHSDEFDYDNMSDDILEFIQTNKLENPILIGHSMGGKLAMNLAVKHPKIINKIIVVDISPRKYEISNLHQEVLDTMISIDFTSISSRQEVEELLEEKFETKYVKLWILKNLYRKPNNSFVWRPNLEIIRKNLLKIKEEVDSQSSCNSQILFIKGGNSDYIVGEDYKIILNNFPNAEIETIKNASHWIHVDKPKELIHTISEFLKR